jgi:hypothetical protein
MKHPSIEDLALYAGGELGLWTRLRTRRHVDGCAQCQREIELFREASLEANAEAARMPAGVLWERLQAEIAANVRLGLAASEAISAYGTQVENPPAMTMSWRMVALTTGFLLLVSVGYWVSTVRRSEQIAAMRGPEPFVAEASDRGVGMSDGSKGMELQGPRTNHGAAVVTVSTTGAAGARYVDEETGQITVNHVYVE